MDTSMNIEKIKRETISDNRGFFLKVMNGYENYLPKSFGEIHIIQCNEESNLILHAYSSIKYNPSDTFSYKF